MRLVSAAGCFFILATALLAQNDRGTITGEVKDQAGVGGSQRDSGRHQHGDRRGVENHHHRHRQLHDSFAAAGHLHAYHRSPGFKKFVRRIFEVQVAITNRVDVPLEVGAASETVTVTAEAAQLKTESAEQSTVIADRP